MNNEAVEPGGGSDRREAHDFINISKKSEGRIACMGEGREAKARGPRRLRFGDARKGGMQGGEGNGGQDGRPKGGGKAREGAKMADEVSIHRQGVGSGRGGGETALAWQTVPIYACLGLGRQNLGGFSNPFVRGVKGAMEL
jgi:hypothetical protein